MRKISDAILISSSSAIKKYVDENLALKQDKIDGALPITKGGTGATDSLNALINLGITDSDINDFNVATYDDWVHTVLNYADQKVEFGSRKPFIFHAGWAGKGYGTAIAWSTIQTFKFAMIFNEAIDGVKFYTKTESNAWVAHRVAEGWKTTASADHSHAEGDSTIASGINSHAEGWHSQATANEAHAEGSETAATGGHSHTEGKKTTASNLCCHAEGLETTASGWGGSHSEGYQTTASGECSHAEGNETKAQGNYSHAGGICTIANTCQTVIGKYNAASDGCSDVWASTPDGNAFIIGNGHGSGSGNRHNAFRVAFDGGVYGLKNFSASGAGVAELFEWADGNPNNEDRRGLFVTLDGDKIRVATPDDIYILGMVDPCPYIVGVVHSEIWKNMYQRDVFGEKIIETIEVAESTDKDGNVIPAHTEKRWVLKAIPHKGINMFENLILGVINVAD